MNSPDYQYALSGAAGAVFLILLFQLALVKAARRRAKTRKIRFMDLIITDEDESYSLSRLQMYLWTVSIIIGFSAVFAAKLEIPDIPSNLYMLMGVNLAAAVTSTVITTAKENGIPVENVRREPDFFKDIFFNSADSLDLPRTQMFAWTIISLLAFFVMLIINFKNNNSTLLPDIPTGLVVLMGLSHGAYLGSKAATKYEAKEG